VTAAGGGLPAPRGRTPGVRERAHNRHGLLLDSAARVFRRKGYALTSMRDIAAEAGMTAGSIYYHYPSKGELLLAVYAEGVRRVGEACDAAAAWPGDAWTRLERVVAAHLDKLLGTQPGDAPFAGVFVQVQPHDFPPEHHEALIALRNGYEAKFRMLIDALPLSRGSDRRLLRLQLIGALNHVPLWYRADGPKTPAAIARTITRQLRRGLAPDRTEP
jgi:TetR/AcrR family transcriptional regulator, cholesterol catabolism regulator